MWYNGICANCPRAAKSYAKMWRGFWYHRSGNFYCSDYCSKDETFLNTIYLQNPMQVLDQVNGVIGSEVAQGFLHKFLG